MLIVQKLIHRSVMCKNLHQVRVFFQFKYDHCTYVEVTRKTHMKKTMTIVNRFYRLHKHIPSFGDTSGSPCQLNPGFLLIFVGFFELCQNFILGCISVAPCKYFSGKSSNQNDRYKSLSPLILSFWRILHAFPFDRNLLALKSGAVLVAVLALYRLQYVSIW